MRLQRKNQKHNYARDAQTPVYHISIVAQMVEIHPQTLRMYERMGLISPQRTRNNIRLYSDRDVETVRRIQHLTQELGVNLAGVEVVFKLLSEMERLRAEVESHLAQTGRDFSVEDLEVEITVEPRTVEPRASGARRVEPQSDGNNGNAGMGALRGTAHNGQRK